MFYKYLNRLYFKKWTIGICRANINEIIRTKTFDPDVFWLKIKSNDAFCADPFLVQGKNGELGILFEEFPYKDDYGKISLMKINKDLKFKNSKIILDTNSHLSYPFVFSENGKMYIFPESAQTGKLSCYEYSPENETITFVKDIINEPLRDSTILKHKDKYWIFGIIPVDESDYELNVYYSDKLLGPYTGHKNNPIRSGLDGTRPAGNFLLVDGEIYRPTQNCKNKYGESITINKIKELNEHSVEEEVYMKLDFSSEKKYKYRINSIHTLNVINDIVVVDGQIGVFAPLRQMKNSFRYRFLKRNNY